VRSERCHKNKEKRIFVAFTTWVKGKSDADFREYVRGTKLNRIEIAADAVLVKAPLTKTKPSRKC
jgi:hypothetical protein